MMQGLLRAPKTALGYDFALRFRGGFASGNRTPLAGDWGDRVVPEADMRSGALRTGTR